MKIPTRNIGFALFLTLAILLHSNEVMAIEDDEDILVGRISHIEGRLLRYIEESNDWVATVKDSPFALDDALYSEDETKVEIILPNKTWLRLGENSQVQLLNLEFDATTIDIASGLGRFYNKSRDTVIKVTTPFGYVIGSAGTVFDLYVGDESLEVIAINGDVDFIHEQSATRYHVREGASSLIANNNETARGDGMVASDWDDWNEEREAIWHHRLRQSTASADLLPEPIRDQAYTLEENGRWERIFHEGGYRTLWRPTRVDPGWRPFTAGRWTVYYGDNCWIPDEPFGYITHHYGSWVFIESSAGWFWMPPVTDRHAGAPKFSIGFAWYPGRVGWLSSGQFLGWVPLAADEEYYAHRHWGRRTQVVNHRMATHPDAAPFRYINEAVVVDRDHFYRGSRYTPFMKKNVGRDALINNYRPTTIVNPTIVNTHNALKHGYAFNDVEVRRKPHNAVIYRIKENQQRKRDVHQPGKQGIEKALMRVKTKTDPAPEIALPRPTLASRLVTAEKMASPFNAIVHDKKELKPREQQWPIDQDKGRQDKKQWAKEAPDRIRLTAGEEVQRQKVKAETPLNPPEVQVQAPDRNTFHKRQLPVRFDENGQRPDGHAGATGEKVEQRRLDQESRQKRRVERQKRQQQVEQKEQGQWPQNQNMVQQTLPAANDPEQRRHTPQGKPVTREYQEPHRQPAHGGNHAQSRRFDARDDQAAKVQEIQRQSQEKQRLPQKEMQRRQEQELLQQQKQLIEAQRRQQEVQQRQLRGHKQQRLPDDSEKQPEHAKKQKKLLDEELMQQQKARTAGGG